MPSSSSRSYSIVEPHPSARSNAYIHTGRGGAGNFTRAPASVTRGSDASGPASRLPPTSLSSQNSNKPFTTGRGGAGNIHPPSERAIFSFDEELERQLSQDRHAAPVYHVGRGGAGNVHFNSSQQMSRKHSDDSASAKSTSSAESGADNATRKVVNGWKKFTSKY